MWTVWNFVRYYSEFTTLLFSLLFLRALLYSTITQLFISYPLLFPPFSCFLHIHHLLAYHCLDAWGCNWPYIAVAADFSQKTIYHNCFGGLSIILSLVLHYSPLWVRPSLVTPDVQDMSHRAFTVWITMFLILWHCIYHLFQMLHFVYIYPVFIFLDLDT